ncbi:MAG: exodeoxyribonuclease III, partial [Planctomycetaceae bacterium]|nr:exodeoxyribonuclease III [Planctomycetaceae bacterium]
KGFLDVVKQLNAEIVCLQETKMQKGQAEIDLPDYFQFWNSAVKKGYSGTAVFSRRKPLAEYYGLGVPKHDQEGRVITLEMDDFFLVNVYTPNARQELVRLDYRIEWENDFRSYLKKLNKTKPIIVCGDFNVAHEEIDLRHPKTNHNNPGFTDQERGKMTELLKIGLADTFRTRYPDTEGAYTWWSFRSNARENNTGWRIDYFLVSQSLLPRVNNAMIYPEIFGSDHCPIGLELANDNKLRTSTRTTSKK